MSEDSPQKGDRRAFELACLAALERELRSEHWAAVSHYELREIWLGGAFPETTIYVRYHDRRDGGEGVFAGGIWQEAQYADDPDAVAIALSIELMER